MESELLLQLEMTKVYHTSVLSTLQRKSEMCNIVKVIIKKLKSKNKCEKEEVCWMHS